MIIILKEFKIKGLLGYKRTNAGATGPFIGLNNNQASLATLYDVSGDSRLVNRHGYSGCEGHAHLMTA